MSDMCARGVQELPNIKKIIIKIEEKNKITQTVIFSNWKGSENTLFNKQTKKKKH